MGYSSQPVMATAATRSHVLGQITKQHGNHYIYLKNGATALDPGKVVSAAAPVANHLELALGAIHPIGARVVRVTVGATAVLADQYKDGFLQVVLNAGVGTQYPILSNTACAASGKTELTLGMHLQQELSATTAVSLVANPNTGVVVAPNGAVVPLGVPQIAVPAKHYFWALFKGLGNVLVAGTPAIGQPVVPAAAVPGAVAALAAGTLVSTVVGTMVGTGQDGEYKPCMLTLNVGSDGI